jgi:plasmid maintenance system antidote protein VapI
MKKAPGRPYPKDIERKMLVMQRLYANEMTQDELADAVGIQKSHLSEIIWGTRRSPATETRIAAFFGLRREDLFPIRTRGDLETMRERGQAA